MKGKAILKAIFNGVLEWTKALKRELVTLDLILRHPKTPFLAKTLAWLTIAYALSPIDLIPDFIPVLGYLDDALLLPVLIWLTLKALPKALIQECREAAIEERLHRGVASYVIAGLILAVWSFAILWGLICVFD